MRASLGPQLTIEADRLVLVEGRDEVNLLGSMIDQWSIVGLQVLPVGGKYGFRSGLEATLASARVQNVQLSAIGILRDADEDPVGAMQSISNILQTIGLPVPQSPGQFTEGTPSVGVFILPDGRSPGAVEQLCWQSVVDTAAGQCSTRYLECLRESRALLSPNPAKTLVHAYLASQEDPSATVGVGAQKSYWPLNHPAFKEVRKFLERLASI